MTSAVLIYPFGFMIELGSFSHAYEPLHCLYVRCLLITFAYFSLVIGLFLLSSRGSSYIKETVVYRLQNFPSLLFVFWLCGNLFSHKEDIVFNVNELFEFVFYGFFVHIDNNPDVRCVWFKFAFLPRWLPCLLNNQSFPYLFEMPPQSWHSHTYLFFLGFSIYIHWSVYLYVDLILFHWSYLIIYIW